MPYKTNGINTMKKYQFVSETKYNKPDDPYFLQKKMKNMYLIQEAMIKKQLMKSLYS